MKVSAFAFVAALTAGFSPSSEGFVIVSPTQGTSHKYHELYKSSIVYSPSTTTFALHSTAATSDSTKTNKKGDSSNLGRDADVIFSIIDVDGDGTITRTELSNHLSVSGYGEAVIDKIFNKMDKNKDDLISEEEFRSGFAVLPGLHSAPGLGNYNSEFVREIYEDADQVFQSLDADKSGSIDEVELKNHLGEMFGKYSDVAIEKIFRLLDVNGDNEISKEELRDAFVRYSALRQAVGEGPNFK